MREGNVLADIKGAVDPAQFDLTRAEGRADLDDALRAELGKIADGRVRAHAGEMVRAWRLELFEAVDQEQKGKANG